MILILVYILSLNAQEKDYDFRCKQNGQLAPKWTCVPMVENMYAEVGSGENVNEAYLSAVCNLKMQLDAEAKKSTFKFKKVALAIIATPSVFSCKVAGIDKSTASSKYLYDEQGLIEKQLDIQKNFYKIETSFAMSNVYKLKVWEGKKNTFVLVVYPEKEFDKQIAENAKKYKSDLDSWHSFEEKKKLESINFDD